MSGASIPEVCVVGVGMTPFGRHPGHSIKSLTQWALDATLTDAGLSLDRIQSAVFANCVQGYMEGQHMVRGQMALRGAGLEEAPIVNVENACASGSTAFHVAVQIVRSGNADVVLAIGAEKMFDADKAKTFGAFEGAWDVHERAGVIRGLERLGVGVPVPSDWHCDRSYSPFMDVYAAFARQHMRQFSSTIEQFAAVAVKNHRHAVDNPLAQYRRQFTVAEVLAAPRVAYPLTVPMCAPVSDGAAAALVCTRSALSRLGLAARRAVTVRASILASGRQHLPENVSEHISARAARQAYEQAGVAPSDVSVAEVHDATAVGEVIQVENLGFCEFGAGGTLAVRGETALGGRLPVNPSGGLLSKGHPIGATGLAQLHELVTQLRGEAGVRQVEGARIAIAENGGGIHGIEEAAACVTILGI